MKSLYDNNFRYIEQAQILDETIVELLAPIFLEYVCREYNPREIARIMMQAINDLELEAILNHKPKETK